MTKAPPNPPKQACFATTKSGEPCRAWAMRNTSPPLCAIHARICRGGAKPGNRNAVKHGFHAQPDPDEPPPLILRPPPGPAYHAAKDLAQRTAAEARAGQDPDTPHLAPDAITRVILDLIDRQEQLSRLIDLVLDDEEDQPLAHVIPLLTRLYALHGQNASRLGRLLRDRQALEGDGDFRDGFRDAWLNLMSEQLGIPL